MANETFNWNNFTRKIYIDKNIEAVYKMISTPAGISKWFIDKAEYATIQNKTRKDDEEAVKGDKYKWFWLYKDLSIEGKVLESEPDRAFKFTFGSAGIVTITLSRVNDKTLVELKQENYPGEQYDQLAYVNCYVCWTFYLCNLKSIAESNFDLRDRDNNYLDGFVNK